ncbi:hypothetical protein, partial [Phascolarctobacterium succinatutens]|uniref:hypothetical protein n=1 Tax=Phascolarctobacterium succinatutens TaxID=626940 RepID=UPI0026F27A8E
RVVDFHHLVIAHAGRTAKKLLSSDEAGDSSFNFGRNIEFKKMIISMQKKKTRALCTVFFLSCVSRKE